MPKFQIDHASGVRLIGAEMLFQSELSKVGEASAIVDMLAMVSESRPLRSVLLLGPRASLLLDQIPTTSAVDVLVRGLPDARSIAAERMMHRTLTVWCGGLDRYAPEAEYDLIVLLDEPSRLLTPDSRPFEHRELLRRVGTWLSDDGMLVVQAANAFSTESLLSLKMEPTKLTNARVEYADSLADEDHEEPLDPPPLPEDENDLWWRGASGFPQRPFFWNELDSAIRASGLEWQASYAAYPTHDQPAMLVNHADAVPLGELARSHAVRLQGALRTTQPFLQEPNALVADVIAAGQLVSLAPSWVAVLHKGVRVDEAPCMVIGDLGIAQRWRMSHTAVHDGDSYLWTTNGTHGSFTQSGNLRRDVLRSNQTPLGSDPLVLQMRDAVSRGNFDVIRRLVQLYTQWLSDLDPGVGLFATPDNVTFRNGQFAIADESWSWTGSGVDTDTMILYCLRHFSLRALKAGLSHPWRPDSSPDEIAQSLAAMAGRAPSAKQLAKVGRLDGEIEALLLDLPAEAHEEFIASSIADGQSSLSAVVGGGVGFRELASRTAQLSIALQTRAEQVEWLEASLRNTRFNLEKSITELGNVRNSLSFKVGRALTSPLRKPVNFVKGRIQNQLNAMTKRKRG